MIEELAKVIDIDGEFAVVVAERQSACGGCTARAGCGTTWLAALLPRRRHCLSIRNDIGAQTGDTVILGLEEKLLQRSSLLLYAVPLIGLLAGAMLGEGASTAFGISAELGSIVAGLMGLSAALMFVRRRTTGDGGQQEVRLLRVEHRLTAIAPGDIRLPEVQVLPGLRERQ